jgi:hypothetical protein
VPVDGGLHGPTGNRTSSHSWGKTEIQIFQIASGERSQFPFAAVSSAGRSNLIIPIMASMALG